MQTRMVHTHALYELLVDLAAHADAVIDPTDLDGPRLERLDYAPVLSDGVVVLDCLTVADAHSQWAGEDDEQARLQVGTRAAQRWIACAAFILEGQGQWREGSSRRTLAIRLANTQSLVAGCETRLQQDGSAEVSWWIFPDHPPGAWQQLPPG